MADYNSIEEIFAAGIDNMEVLINNTSYDDNVFTASGADWLKFNNVTVANVYVSGNTFFGFGTNSEHLKVNRRDTKMWYLYREEGTLFNYYRFLKFRWQGYSVYNQTSASYLLTYDVVLWENGCISLRMVNIPTSSYDGTFQLTAASALTYTKPTAATPDVTFTPQDENNTTFAVSYEVIDLAPPYDRKYLIRSGSTLYTITDGALSALTEAEVTASLFQTYGVDELPDGSLLLSLTDPEVLYWHDSTDELPALTIGVTGSPPVPQTVITGPQDMSDPTILGIESASVDASDDVLFALSFDDGATWKAYSGTGWVTLETENAGMTKATMENIGLEAWAEVVTSDSYRVRFTLVSVDSYVTGVVIHYINEESEEESNA